MSVDITSRLFCKQNKTKKKLDKRIAIVDLPIPRTVILYVCFVSLKKGYSAFYST